jgi:hypothetical protein
VEGVVAAVDAMIATLRARMTRRGPTLDDWQHAAARAYAESARTTLPMMTDAQVEARLGWKLHTPRDH